MIDNSYILETFTPLSILVFFLILIFNCELFSYIMCLLYIFEEYSSILALDFIATFF